MLNEPLNVVDPELKDGWKNKENIRYILKHYLEAIVAISVVHLRGSVKHGFFTYLNEPDGNDGLIDNDLNAIARHLYAHSIGFLTDDDNLPHLWHVLCRAEMAVAQYYRSTLKYYIKPNTYEISDQQDFRLGVFFSPYIYIPLSKISSYEEKYKDTSENELLLLLHVVLTECMLEKYSDDDNSKTVDLVNIFQKELSKLEEFFILSILYMYKFYHNEDWEKIVDSISEQDRDFINRYVKKTRFNILKREDAIFLEKYKKEQEEQRAKQEEENAERYNNIVDQIEGVYTAAHNFNSQFDN